MTSGDVMGGPFRDYGKQMFTASALLAAAGFFLLAGSLLWFVAYSSLNWLAIFAFPALAVQISAWGVLGDVLSSHSGTDFESATRLRRPLVGTYLASLVGFVLGLAILPSVYPRYWSSLFSFLAFPYIPAVYVPVVASLASLFFIAAGPVRDPSARVRMYLGCCLSLTAIPLGIIGSLLAGEQIALGAWVIMTTIPSGIMASGYALVALGWRRTHRLARRGASATP